MNSKNLMRKYTKKYNYKDIHKAKMERRKEEEKNKTDKRTLLEKLKNINKGQ